MPSKSNREYRVWHSSEEEALRRGVKKHGLGAWEVIRTDPEFSVLSCRSGVQLKDKWRNLVKFKHVTQADIQALQRRTSGPWSKKYGLQQRKPGGDDQPSSGSQARASDGAAEQQEQDGADDAGNAASHAVAERPRRRTAAARAYNFDTSSSSTSDPGPGDDTRPPKRTCPAEDRRFGIYDQRRYDKSSAAAAPSASDPARPASAAGGGPVLCTCGVDYDDGQLMIECERCGCWAHPACLERLQSQQPDRFRFSFENYHCVSCQLGARAARRPTSGSDTDGSDHFHQYGARHPPTPPHAAPLQWAAQGRRAMQRYRPRSTASARAPVDPAAAPPGWGGTLALTQSLPPAVAPPSPTPDLPPADPMHWLRAPTPPNKPALPKSATFPTSTRSAFQPCAAASADPLGHPYASSPASRPHLARASTLPSGPPLRSLTQVAKVHPAHAEPSALSAPAGAHDPPRTAPRRSPFTLPPTSDTPQLSLLPHVLAMQPHPHPAPQPSQRAPSLLLPPSAFRAAALSSAPFPPAGPPLAASRSLGPSDSGLQVLASAAVKAEPRDAFPDSSAAAGMYRLWAEKDVPPQEAAAEALEAAKTLSSPLSSPLRGNSPIPGAGPTQAPITLCRSASNSMLLSGGEHEAGSRELDPTDETAWPPGVAHELALLPDNPTPPPALACASGPRDDPPDALWGSGDILPPSHGISNPLPPAPPYCTSPGLTAALLAAPKPPDAALQQPPPTHTHAPFSDSLRSTSSTCTQYSLPALNSPGVHDMSLSPIPRPLTLTGTDPSLPALYAMNSCPNFPVAPHANPNPLAQLSTPDIFFSRGMPLPHDLPLRFLGDIQPSSRPPPTLSCPSYPPPTHTFLSSHHQHHHHQHHQHHHPHPPLHTMAPPPVPPPNPSPFALPVNPTPPFSTARLHALASHPPNALHSLRDPPVSSFKRYQPHPRDPQHLAQLLSDPSLIALPALLSGRRTPPFLSSRHPTPTLLNPPPPLLDRTSGLTALPPQHPSGMPPLPDDYQGGFGAPGGMPLL